jgi:hypothetical protein
MGINIAMDSGSEVLASPDTEKDVAALESSPEITPITSPTNADRLQEERRVRRKIDAVVLPTVSTIIASGLSSRNSSRKF